MIFWIAVGIGSTVVIIFAVIIYIVIRNINSTNWVHKAINYPGLRGPLTLEALYPTGLSPEEYRAALVEAFIGRDDVITVGIKLGALKDRSPIVRRAAAEAFSLTGGHPTWAIEVVPALSKACLDRDPNVRASAQKALESWQGWLKKR